MNPSSAEVAHQHLGREDPHHDLLAERRRHRRDPQLDLVAGGRDRLDPAVLRAPLLDDLHPREELDPGRHRDQHRRGNGVDLVQHAVDAKAHLPGVAPRLDVDVGGALLERVLPEPVDDVDDVAVVGVELALLAERDELLEVAGERHRALRGLLRLLHRAGEVVELAQVAPDVLRIGEDELHVELQDLLELVGPVADERLRRGHRQRRAGHLDRQDPVPFRVGVGHRLRDGREIDLQRIDVQVRHPELPGEPLDQPVERQKLPRPGGRVPVLVGDDLERMLGGPGPRAGQRVGVGGRDEPVGDEQRQDFLEAQRASGDSLHCDSLPLRVGRLVAGVAMSRLYTQESCNDNGARPSRLHAQSRIRSPRRAAPAPPAPRTPRGGRRRTTGRSPSSSTARR